MLGVCVDELVQIHMTCIYNSNIKPLETAGLGKILHIFSVSIEMLQILTLISEDSSCIVAIFLNKINSPGN